MYRTLHRLGASLAGAKQLGDRIDVFRLTASQGEGTIVFAFCVASGMDGRCLHCSGG